MGANCCISARSDSLPIRTGLEIPAHRNLRYSPSWSFGWDNRTHVENFVDEQARLSYSNTANPSSDVKSRVDTDTGLPDGRSPFRCLQTPSQQKCSNLVKTVADITNGLSTGSNSPREESDHTKTLTKSRMPDHKLSIQTPCPPSLSFIAGSSSSDLSSSRKACCSPSSQLSLQDFENNTEVPPCKSEMSAGGSHRGSSGSWSMQMFTELIGSSKKNGCFFGGENLNFYNGKVTTPDNRHLCSPPRDSQTCGVCCEHLRQRSLHRNLELSAVAVLVCGHVYHADCLEKVTPEVDVYDPPCPVCTYVKSSPLEVLKKAELKARRKNSRITLADSDLDNVFTTDGGKQSESKEKFPRLGASSSLKSSFGRPFMKRHLSGGLKTTPRSLSENERSRKKGFWAKYRRD